jgi:hypothetical protein
MADCFVMLVSFVSPQTSYGQGQAKKVVHHVVQA